MKSLFFLLIFATTIGVSGCSQSSSQKQGKDLGNSTNIKVGERCEGCEAIYESPVPFDQLNSIDTLPDFNEQGPKIEISGIVYQRDGKTPAQNVVIYVYHTDQIGHYTPGKNATGWEKRHGYIRGWMKTNAKGEYKFYTLMPGHYPGTTVPAHIHPTIKEPDKNEYYIDEYLFDDDPSLTTAERKRQEGRGGNGIVALEEKDGMLYGERDIYLGRNIPDYPHAKITGLQSGLDLGDNCPAFDPLHLTGADSGKQICPMCKYGYGQGVMVWFNHAGLDQLKEFAKTLETEMIQRGEKKLRVFLVYMNPYYNQNSTKGLEILRGKLRKWCAEQGLKHVAMLWVPSPVDPETCGLYKINPEVKNTVFVYKKRKVITKWVNIEYNNEMLKNILKTFDQRI